MHANSPVNIPQIIRAHKTASFYEDNGSRNSDGSSYSTWHCASRDYPRNSVLGIYHKSKTKHGVKLVKIFEIPNRDLCGVPGRVDFTRNAYRVLASRCGIRNGFQRGLIPIEVKFIRRGKKVHHAHHKR